MSSKKSIILGIHIDSKEVNFAACYFDSQDQKLKVLGLHSGVLQGISKGCITKYDQFSDSFTNELHKFTSTHLQVSNPALANKYGITLGEKGVIPISRVAINMLQTGMKSNANIMQDPIVKPLIQNFFSDKVAIVEGDNIFRLTSDVAACNLFIPDRAQNQIPGVIYSINIHLCRNSCWINFIDNNTQTVLSHNIELGFESLAEKYNKRFGNQPILYFYNLLRNFQFKVQNTSNMRVLFDTQRITTQELNNMFVAPIQYIFTQCYEKFKKLDSENRRFEKDFMSKTVINFTGYGADFRDLDAVAALMFSHHLKEEIETLQEQQQLLKDGVARTDLPVRLPSNNRELVYLTDRDQITFHHQKYRVEQHVEFLPVCERMQGIHDRSTLEHWYVRNINQFAVCLGLIYSFYQNKPQERAHGLFYVLLKKFHLIS